MEAPRLVREISNERIIDELKCEAAICKAGTVFDGRIANAMHTKAEINAAEAQAASTDFMKDIAQLKRRAALEMADYECRITLAKVDENTLERRIVMKEVELSMAQDDLSHQIKANTIFQRQITMEQSATRALTKQNAALRSRVEGLRRELTAASEALDKRGHEANQVVEQLRNEREQLNRDLTAAQSTMTSLREQLALAERTSTAAQERAALAEQTLRQRETLAQAQSNVDHSSQEFIKTELEAERRKRSEAEARASAAEAKSASLEKEYATLQRQVESKDRRISSLEETIKQREVATPAGAKAVHAALDAVGTFVSQLDISPEAMPASQPIEKVRLMPRKANASTSSQAVQKKQEKQQQQQQPKETTKVKRRAGNRMAAPSPESLLENKEHIVDEARTKRGGKAATKRKRQLQSDDKENEAADDDETTTGDKVGGKKRTSRNINSKSAADDKDDANRATEDKENDSTNAIESMLVVRPLDALNSKVVAAAEKQSSGGGGGPTAVPLKPSLARPILGRLGAGPGGNDGKRRLLGVSSSVSVMRDALPVSMLFGNNFQAPQLKGKK